MAEGRRIAVVGSGISGLTAAFLLTRHDHRAMPDYQMLCDRRWPARRVPLSANAGQLRVHDLASEGGSYTTCRPHAGIRKKDQLRITSMIVQRRADNPPLHSRSGASVTLYEKEQVFGGHTLTDDSSPYPVDLGFQVLALGVPRPCHPHAVLNYRSIDCDFESSKHAMCHQGDINVMSGFKPQRLCKTFCCVPPHS